MSADPNDLARRMDGAIESLNKEFSGLRTGRASTALLENISIEAYGSKMPMNQVGSISVPEPRLLTVQVWDNGLVKDVEKAIQESNLGLNPQTEGNLIRVPIPDLSEERRIDLTKVAAKFGEQARVAVRNVRRDGMDSLKKSEKEGKISKDEQHTLGEDIQKLTDEHIALIDQMLSEKEQEILQV
ncbi:MAG: ribosome recycling factor [Alphaproteobacteria bacterium]|nr:ribosome recycling factor [Alphaproteobacteria bacterium]